jgi:hypothetical protein
VTNKVMDTGESAQKLVNHCAGNADAPVLPVVDLLVCFFTIAYEAMGAAMHLAFPAPSSFEGGSHITRARKRARRECGRAPFRLFDI